MAVLKAAAVVLPGWARGNVRVEGPDEDELTLLARAGELLLREGRRAGRDARAPSRLRLVSDLSGEERTSLFEAWGIPPVEVVAFARSPSGAREALAAALDEPGGTEEGPSWALTAQVAGLPGTAADAVPRHSAGAVALAFARARSPSGPAGRGAAPGPLPPSAPSPAAENVPDARPPVPRTWITGARAGRAPASLVQGTASPPVDISGLRGPPDGPFPVFLTLADAALRSSPGEPGAWVHATDEVTALRLFLDGGEVRVIGLPPEAGEPLQVGEEAWRARGGAPLGAVSQGAYVSRATYLASLPSRWRLEGERCPGCAGWTFPPSGRCPKCGRKEGLERRGLSKEGGLVVASTVIRPGAQPTEFDFHQESAGPYAVALVRFPEGPCLTFQVTDGPPDGPLRDRRVELVLRRLYPQEGAWRYGLKAVLLPGAGPVEARPPSPGTGGGGRSPVVGRAPR